MKERSITRFQASKSGLQALASAMAGADGIILEIHENPEKAATDGQQTLNYREFDELVIKLKKLEELQF